MPWLCGFPKKRLVGLCVIQGVGLDAPQIGSSMILLKLLLALIVRKRTSMYNDSILIVTTWGGLFVDVTPCLRGFPETSGQSLWDTGCGTGWPSGVTQQG